MQIIMDNDVSIPSAMREDCSLSDEAKKLYSEMYIWADTNRVCTEKNVHFSRIFSVTPRTISTWKSELESQGYIKTTIAGKGFSYCELCVNGERENFNISSSFRANLSCNLQSRLLTIPYTNTSNIHTKKINIGNDTLSNKRRQVSTKSNVNHSPREQSMFALECIAIWNREEGVPKHIHPNTKVRKDISKMIGQLLNGTFGQGKYFESNYKVRSGVDSLITSRKFTKAEIKRAIKRLALYFKGEYLPKDKKKLPKSLADLMYNTRRNTSFFLEACMKPPVKVKEDKARLVNKTIDEVIEGSDNPIPINMFVNAIGRERLDSMDKIDRLVEGVESLIKFQRKIHNVDNHIISRLLGTPIDLCREYLDWIKKQEWMSRLEIGAIFSKSKVFETFIYEFEGDNQVLLDERESL